MATPWWHQPGLALFRACQLLPWRDDVFNKTRALLIGTDLEAGLYVNAWMCWFLDENPVAVNFSSSAVWTLDSEG